MEGTISVAKKLNLSVQARDTATDFEHTVKVCVLRNITVEGLELFLKQHLLTDSIRPELVFGGYGTMVQDAMVEGGIVSQADLVVLSLTLEELDPSCRGPGWHGDEVRASLGEMFELLRTHTRATIVLNTFVVPPFPETGLFLPDDGSDLQSQMFEINRFITDWARKHAAQFVLTDWNRYVGLLGIQAALDERGRYLWKAPYKRAFLDLYARDIARIASLIKGRTKKCLVLDCDNTLWGGVIGEDGLYGIALDASQYPGKVYFDFQTSILNLAERGVILALCSKNNADDVFDVLDRHPACRLKRRHFSAMRLDWRNKAENILDLAAELNLGLDSFVYVDDNPAECALIRARLPEVTVLAVPPKLHELPSLLAREAHFNSLAVTAEDRSRTELYHADSQRKSARAAIPTLEEYLRNLEMAVSIHPARRKEFARIAQLTQKTNQFNLTTRRYSEQAIEQFANQADAAVFSMSVRDRFGDLGLIGAMIVLRDGAAARIDTLLLSCRALGRGLEQAFAEHVLDALAARWDVTNWRAEYIPTRKNQQAANFWSEMGFADLRQDDGHKYYVRDGRAPRRDMPAHLFIDED